MTAKFHGVLLDMELYMGDHRDGYCKDLVIFDADIDDKEEFEGVCDLYELTPPSENKTDLIQFLNTYFLYDLQRICIYS